MQNLGVFGDSWADVNPAYTQDKSKNILPWPMWVAEKLDCNLSCFASSGTGLWWSFDQFKKKYKRLEKVIFVYTDYGRWNGLPDDLLNLAHIREEHQLEWVSKDNVEYAKKLVDVYPFLYNDDLNKFVYQQIFNEVNLLCDKFGIQITNILPFDYKGPRIDISNRKGPVLYNLASIYYHELKVCKGLNDYVANHYDVRHCHINPINNIALADIIVETLGNTNAVLNLFECKNFVYNDDELAHFKEFWNTHPKETKK